MLRSRFCTALRLALPILFVALAVALLPSPARAEVPGFFAWGDQDGGVTFDRWVTGFSAAYSNGTYVYGRWTNTELTARFKGDGIGVGGPKQPNYGRADVYIDGAFKGTVDSYAPKTATGWRDRIWESAALTRGPHYIQIKPTGTKRTASTNNIVVVDALDVTP